MELQKGDLILLKSGQRVRFNRLHEKDKELCWVNYRGFGKYNSYAELILISNIVGIVRKGNK